MQFRIEWSNMSSIFILSIYLSMYKLRAYTRRWTVGHLECI